MRSDPQLRRWYRQFNRKYFNGELTDEVTIFYDASGGDLGECVMESDDEFTVRVDPSIRFSNAMAKMTVLHEMVHVKLAPYLGHGKKFQDEMKRLAEMNAFKGMW